MNMKYGFLILCTLVLSAFHVSEETPQQLIQKRIMSADFSVGEERAYAIKSLTDIYTDAGFQPLWKKSTIEELINWLVEVNAEGLDREDYHYHLIRELYNQFPSLSTAQQVDLELLCSDAFLLCASHLLSGKVNPETIDTEWHVVRREGDPAALLTTISETGKLKSTVSTMLPRHPVYLSLKNALAKYLVIQRDGGWEAIPEGETLRIGMESERVTAVKNRLRITGDFAEGEAPPQQFDQALHDAVVNYQQRNGLQSDGAIGKGTLASMNVPVDKRIEQIRVNMERWRWLPQEFSDYYLKVNIAAFTLEVVRNNTVERNHKVIVGKIARRTPVLSSTMSNVVLNPTWTVPPTILREDVIPEVRKNSHYLNKKNLQVLDAQGNVVNPATINWHGKLGAYTFRQPAGPDNALGEVKFNFKNSFNVYLHDTPSRDLFQHTDRSFSSGCIRVEEPLKLAEYLLNTEGKWSMSKIKEIVSTRKTTYLAIKNKPDIYILYWTAWTDTDGVIQFRNDVYNRDPALAGALREHPE